MDREGVIALIEQLLEFCWPSDMKRIAIPFVRMTYSDAMCNYGSDKPDLRFDSKVQFTVILAFIWMSSTL